MTSKQEKLKKALNQQKQKARKPVIKKSKLSFEEVKQRRETNHHLGCIVLKKPPVSLKEQRDLAHFQWTQARYFMERTNCKRLPLEPYNGSWIKIMGVISEARYLKGNLRLCIASPELIALDSKGNVETRLIDSHLWIKMSNFILNDEDDGRVDHRPDAGGDFGEGIISLGDMITFDALIEPYIKGGKVKYGVSKFKNLSNGSLLWRYENGKKSEYRQLDHYHREGYLIKATQLPGTNKFSYQYATYEMVKAQTDYFENYQSNYGLKEERKVRNTQ
jgi:hypothetical protein